MTSLSARMTEKELKNFAEQSESYKRDGGGDRYITARTGFRTKKGEKRNGAGGRNATLRYKIEYHIPIHCQRNESWTGAMNMFLGICIACIIKNAGAGQISPAAAVEM